MKNNSIVLQVTTMEANKKVVNNQKNKSVNIACNKQIHSILEIQLLTYKEVADYLRVSERTIRRLVDENLLNAVYIRKTPRIRATDLLDYLQGQSDQCYNEKRMVLNVRKISKGKRTCKNQRNRKVYTKEETQNSGGSVTSMNPAKELAALLEL